MAYPYPVIAACNGHALAMGVFLMLSADYVIGSRGDFKIAANRVTIGLTMPRVAAAVLASRLLLTRGPLGARCQNAQDPHRPCIDEARPASGRPVRSHRHHC